MNNQMKTTLLRGFLRLLSAAYVAVFIAWISLILARAPALAPGGSLAPLLRFQPYNPAMESMIAAIHIVWGVMLWRASDDPRRHVLLIDFTIWANIAHGLVMLVATPLQKGPIMTLIEGVPLFVVSAVLLLLRPRTADAGAVAV